MDRVAETKAAWERAQAEVQRAQAEAVEDLVRSGIRLCEVAELLGISKKELHSLCGTTPVRRTKASDRMNVSVALEAQSS